MAGSSKYYMSDMMTKLFVNKAFDGPGSTELTFRDLTTVDQYWQYVCTLVLDNMFGESSEVLLEDPKPSGDLLFLGDVNIVLGPPRLRQLRVRNGSCSIHELFQTHFRDCYSAFSSSIIDMDPFGQRNKIPLAFSKYLTAK